MPACAVTSAKVRVVGEAEVLVSAEATCAGELHVTIWPRGGARPGAEPLGVARGPCCSLRLGLRGGLAAWSPDSPALYEAHLVLDGGADTVVQHFARRVVAREGDRVLLNGEPIFTHGVLYQGYWPESLLTPPSEQALREDLVAIKAAGFNAVRVHAVVMGAPLYMLCDELGLLVWQDMPSGDGRVLPVWEARRHDGDVAAQLEVSRGGAARSLDEIVRTPDSQAASQKRAKQQNKTT